MDMDIANEREHGQRDDSDIEMKQFTGCIKYMMKRDSSK